MDYIEALTIILGVPVISIVLLVTVSIARQITLAGGQSANVFSDIADKFRTQHKQ